ncbi:hypothetical protein JTB14_015210 [Gonioctena quinquepunctata]|nr:hypothetical protein JTB14_015210 [Gonioctena quinquepunctata]
MSKIFEKLPLERQQHINETLGDRKYCSADFLDISQPSDKVWHTGLLYEIIKSIPLNYFVILKSSPENFLVQYQDEQIILYPIEADVPQGSVLKPLLYLLYTADLPTKRNILIATYADNTADYLEDIQTWLNKWRLK